MTAQVQHPEGGVAPRSMSDTDALLWTIGRDPVLRTTIAAVVLFDGTPPWQEVRDRFGALTGLVPGLRSRVQPAPLGWGRPRWVVDDGFDLDVHLRRVVMPPPGDLRAVLDFAQSMAVVGFDPAMALWEAVMVEGLEGGRSALVVKFHHAIADGLGSITAALGLLDDVAARPGKTPRRAPRAPREAPSTRPPGVASEVLRAALHPDRAWRDTWATVGSVAKLLAPARHPLSPLWAGRGLGRSFEVLDVATPALHAVARATATTVNDVFVAAVLGGVRAYHEQHGAPGDRFRLLMPISVRDARDADFGNRFVPARFVLEAAPDPRVRLRHVHQTTASWKHAPSLALNDVLAAGLDALPPRLATALWGGMLKGDDVVATNVPGPAADTALAGARLERLYAFSPPSGAALNVSLVTVADRACVALNADTSAVADVGVLRRCMAAAFDEVLDLAGRPVPVEA